jgi:hypothetical protein
VGIARRIAEFVAFAAFISQITLRKAKLGSKMSDNGEFSVIDGKLVREEKYDANFEENLTFEEDEE